MYRSNQAWHNLRLIKVIVTLVSLLVVCSCTTSEKTTSAEYLSEIKHWQQLRVDSLKGQTGYLNLAGLFWLSNEISSIGADSSNTIIFPTKAAKNLGNLLIKRRFYLVYTA